PRGQERRVQPGADRAPLRRRLRAARPVREQRPDHPAGRAGVVVNPTARGGEFLAQGTTATTDDADARFRSSTSATRALLACAVVAGPLYEVVFLAQAFTRPGFDVTRHT